MSACKRSGNNLKDCTDLYLKANARIWPLTVLFVPRSSAPPPRHSGSELRTRLGARTSRSPPLSRYLSVGLSLSLCISISLPLSLSLLLSLSRSHSLSVSLSLSLSLSLPHPHTRCLSRCGRGTPDTRSTTGSSRTARPSWSASRLRAPSHIFKNGYFYKGTHQPTIKRTSFEMSIWLLFCTKRPFL